MHRVKSDQRPHVDTQPVTAQQVFETCWNAVSTANLRQLSRIREDLMTWRRGSAQVALLVNPSLNNLTIYSVLVTGTEPSLEFFRYLLRYNILQRRECLGFVEKQDQFYVVMKYTMELELAMPDILQRNIYAFQETADKMDNDLVAVFGGSLHFEDWEKLDQPAVDNLLDQLFG